LTSPIGFRQSKTVPVCITSARSRVVVTKVEKQSHLRRRRKDRADRRSDIKEDNKSTNANVYSMHIA